MGSPRASEPLPILARFPALARVPRVPIGDFPTPLERVRDDSLRGALWVKRDDLSAPRVGGNKVRALEWLLGGVRASDELIVLGGLGSTQVLATAEHAAALGARTHAERWRHELTPLAEATMRRAEVVCASARDHWTPVGAVLRASLRRVRGARWIPIGGTSPLGMLGHVNAALELAEQVQRGQMPAPARLVLPLGSGGTAAGLALGLAIAGLETEVIGARVVPRPLATARRVRALAASAARFIERRTGERLPRVRADAVRVVHDVYAGAYGRPLPSSLEAVELARRALSLALDATYSAKAFTAALDLARRSEGVTLFWSTFDSRELVPNR